jgi:hypothetical protein
MSKPVERDNQFSIEVPARDRLFVNDERTLLVRLWADGTCEVAVREASYHTWGPPTYLTEEVTK